MNCSNQGICCCTGSHRRCFCRNCACARRENAGTNICESVNDIREGICCLNHGLEDIVNRNFCEGNKKIGFGISLIKRAISKILKCLQIVRCDLDISELRRIRDGIIMILAGIQVIYVGIKAICSGNRDDGIGIIRRGIQNVKDGLVGINEGLGDLLCEENANNVNNGH